MIKLRAWDERNRVMHYDFQFIKSGEEGNDWIIFTSDKQKLSDALSPLENPYFSQQLKIRQAVGREDKNGKEIYFGDVLATSNDDPNYDIWDKEDNGYTIVQEKTDELGVSFSDWGMEINNPESIYGQSFVEIIGNIYENPELLEQV